MGGWGHWPIQACDKQLPRFRRAVLAEKGDASAYFGVGGWGIAGDPKTPARQELIKS
jgi:hypothetical protein